MAKHCDDRLEADLLDLIGRYGQQIANAIDDGHVRAALYLAEAVGELAGTVNGTREAFKPATKNNA